MKISIKLTALIILSIIFSTGSVIAAPVKATRVVMESTINDDVYSTIKMNTVNISGDTFVMLDDLAYILDGTLSSFDLTTDSSKNAIRVITQRQYVAKKLSSVDDVKDKSVENATLAAPIVYVNGNKTKLTAYVINGNHYFKLKDLTTVFTFTFKIKGDKLTFKPSEKAVFNGLPYYLTQAVSADGKTTSTDASIKKQFGDPVPIFTFKNDGTYTVVRNGKTFKGKITDNSGDNFTISTIGDPKVKTGAKYLVFIVGDTYNISTNPNVGYSSGYLLTPSLKTVDLTSGAPTPPISPGVSYPPGTSPEEINKAISDYLKENGVPVPTDTPKQ